MGSMEEMVKCIEQNYARKGVEVDSSSDEELVVNIPASFVHLSKFCGQLETEFNATTRMEYSNNRVQLIVYIGHLSTQPHAPPEPDTLSYVTLMWRFLLLLAVIFIVQCTSVGHRNLVKDIVLSFLAHIATIVRDLGYAMT